MQSLARWSYRHRKLVVVGWIALLVALGAVSNKVGNAYSDNFDLPGVESVKALELLKERAPASSGESAQVVFASKDGATLKDGANKRSIDALVAKLSAMPHVAAVHSPYDGAQPTISADGTVGFATLNFDQLADKLPVKAIRDVVKTAQAAESSTLRIELGGSVIQYADQGKPPATEAIGLLVAAAVLFITFGSLVAMAVPLLVAVIALGTGLSLIGLLTHLMNVAQFAPTLAALIGLGVGIDYALFIVTRFRAALHEGMTVEQSVVRAVNTAGRAVLFAGTIVCIALLGMFALGVNFLYGVAVSSSVIVAVTMLASLTLLPAMLGMLGMRIDKLRFHRRGRTLAAQAGLSDSDQQGERGWARWASWIQRRPVAATVAGTVALLALCIPALDLRLGSSDAGNDPKGSTTRQAYDLLAQGFGPGFNGPFLLVADLDKPSDLAAVDKVVTKLKADPGVATVSPAQALPDGKTALVTVYAKSAPQDEATTKLLDRMRMQIVPSETQNSGAHVYVGGATAIFADFGSVLSSKLPTFIGVVVLLSVLLLMAVFRSLAVPLKAALMNLLSIGAAFGVVVAVFQWGWGAGLLGVKPGPVEAFLPVMLFAILFGLSMDYEVFLVSRIHEEWVRTKDNTLAVTRGLATTGRVITAAATIMVVVFGSFVLGGQRVIQLFGIGLASAVLIDALIIRSLLVPGLMQLLGKVNWWLPAWLDRLLPNISVEGAEEEPASGPDEAEREPVLV